MNRNSIGHSHAPLLKLDPDSLNKRQGHFNLILNLFEFQRKSKKFLVMLCPGRQTISSVNLAYERNAQHREPSVL